MTSATRCCARSRDASPRSSPARAFISRIGGDEFTVVLANIGQRSFIDALSQDLLDSLKTPIDARGIAIEVGVSIGIAVFPDHARDSKELLRHADVAMYVAKRQGSAFDYYEREHDQHTVRRLSMMSELRAAIENSGIGLHYQPQMNLRTGRAESVEALVRWQHAMHGSVGPAEFVTLAESTDLIRPLTDWTISQALARCRELEQPQPRAARRGQFVRARSAGRGLSVTLAAALGRAFRAAEAARARDHGERHDARPGSRAKDRHASCKRSVC